VHAAVADRLERAYGPAAAEHVTELATHFLLGRDDARAVQYLQAAAEQALGRSAQLEAVQHLGALLQAVQRLPEGPDRDRAELRARITLGPALIATRGFASPAVEGAFLRARELCRRLGDPPELAVVLHGLAAVNEFRGRYHVSEEILKQLLGAGDSPLAVEAHELLACSTFHQGRAATAVRYAEAGLALYDEDRDSGFLAPYGEHRPSPATTTGGPGPVVPGPPRPRHGPRHPRPGPGPRARLQPGRRRGPADHDLPGASPAVQGGVSPVGLGCAAGGCTA
jgi:tetratricopeptide (TPR) repeat protein